MSLILSPQCCCESGCDVLTECLAVKSPEVTISGIVNSLCGDCTNLNGTYLPPSAGQLMSPPLCCFRYVMIPPLPFFCSSFSFWNRVIVQFTARYDIQQAKLKVMASRQGGSFGQPAFWLKWELTDGAALSAFASLCDGEEMAIPLSGWYSTPSVSPDLVESCFIAQLPPTPTAAVCDEGNAVCLLSLV